MTYLYIFGEEVGDTLSPNLKIGIANSPGGRRRQIQTGNPRPLIELHAEAFPSHREARRVENQVHRTLGAHRLSGEWFNVSIESVLAAVREAVL